MMGIKKRSSPFLWLLLAGTGAPVIAEDPPERPTAPEIPQTQLTLRLNPLQGRATVVAIAEQTLTIVTAAHFLSPEDAGRTILIQGEGALRGRLEAVTRNPGFQPLRSRTTDVPTAVGTLGVDTAVALIKVDLRRENERRRVRQDPLRRMDQGPPAETLRPDPERAHRGSVRSGARRPGGQSPEPAMSRLGRQNYDTQRGDSGSGVFLMRKTPEGQSLPILIGNVSQTDERGGLASLAHRNEYWIVRAMAGLPPERN